MYCYFVLHGTRIVALLLQVRSVRVTIGKVLLVTLTRF